MKDNDDTLFWCTLIGVVLIMVLVYALTGIRVK